MSTVITGAPQGPWPSGRMLSYTFQVCSYSRSYWVHACLYVLANNPPLQYKYFYTCITTTLGLARWTVVKISDCSPRGPRLDFHNPHELPTTLVLRNPCFCVSMYREGTDICTGKICIHIKINLKKESDNHRHNISSKQCFPT